MGDRTLVERVDLSALFRGLFNSTLCGCGMCQLSGGCIRDLHVEKCPNLDDWYGCCVGWVGT